MKINVLFFKKVNKKSLEVRKWLKEDLKEK